MAKRAVDVAVTLKRSLRFTLRTAEDFFVPPTLHPTRGRQGGASGAAFAPSRRTSVGHAAVAQQGELVPPGNVDKGEGEGDVARQRHSIPAGTHFVDVASSPEDVLAVMVGKAVAGKTTFAIPVDMLVGSEPSAPARASSATVEVDEDLRPSLNPRGEADDLVDAESNPLLNAIVSSVSAMPSSMSSLPASPSALGLHDIAHSRSVSVKEAASIALKPGDLSRLDFQTQQKQQFHDRRSRLGAPALHPSAAHDSSPPLPLIDRCVELAANWKIHELASFLEQHREVLHPASLRCGDEQATLLHFVATHTPPSRPLGVSMKQQHASSKNSTIKNARRTHVQDQCFQLVRYLVDVCGIPIDGGARNGATPLHWAAGHGNVSEPLCIFSFFVVLARPLRICAPR